MDSDLTGFIIAVIVAVCMGYIESRSKAKKKQQLRAQKAPVRQREHAPALVRERKPSPAAQPQPHAAKTQKATAPDPFISGEEGLRVTADTNTDFHVEEPQPRLRPLDRDGLRNAVIWGEILRPKF